MTGKLEEVKQRLAKLGEQGRIRAYAVTECGMEGADGAVCN